MSVRYYKRHLMELDLSRSSALSPPPLPAPWRWIPWHDSHLERFAEVMHASFANELDAEVFANLSNMTGCQLLMNCIRDSEGFCPEATWLIANDQFCVGTVQGLIDAKVGAVQNLGVVASYRGLGLGACLLLKALQGFQACGIQRARLEVTARNEPAIQLYRRLGFRSYKTTYTSVVRPDPVELGIGI